VSQVSDQAQGSGELVELAELAATCARELAGQIDTITSMVMETLAADGVLLFCGNGGSAADAQHLAAEYMIRFRRDRGPLRAMALTTDSSILTAGGNDLGFEEVFARQVEALGREGDLLFVHSTSGESENVVRAVTAARRAGLRTVGLLAKGGGRLKEAVDVAVIVPTESTARAQELHLAIGHTVCDRVDRTLSEQAQ
jgi:D-sedoheptulose 7-phosphate isomerase